MSVTEGCGCRSDVECRDRVTSLYEELKGHRTGQGYHLIASTPVVKRTTGLFCNMQSEAFKLELSDSDSEDDRCSEVPPPKENDADDPRIVPIIDEDCEAVHEIEEAASKAEEAAKSIFSRQPKDNKNPLSEARLIHVKEKRQPEPLNNSNDESDDLPWKKELDSRLESLSEEIGEGEELILCGIAHEKDGRALLFNCVKEVPGSDDRSVKTASTHEQKEIIVNLIHNTLGFKENQQTCPSEPSEKAAKGGPKYAILGFEHPTQAGWAMLADYIQYYHDNSSELGDKPWLVRFLGGSE